MRRCFLCLFLVFGFISLNGQAVLTEVKSIAKDLGENLGKGFYQKSWKKNKDTWLTNLANASDEKTVHAMVTTLADNISEKAYNNTVTYTPGCGNKDTDLLVEKTQQGLARLAEYYTQDNPTFKAFVNIDKQCKYCVFSGVCRRDEWHQTNEQSSERA